MSSFEQAKEFTKPVNGNSKSAIPEDLIDAQQKIASEESFPNIELKSNFIRKHKSWSHDRNIQAERNGKERGVVNY